MICRICQAREVSCRITERQADGSFAETLYCEPCFHEAVPDWMHQATPKPSVESLAQMISGLQSLGRPSVAEDEAARMAREIVDRWEKRQPPPHRSG